MDRELTIRIDVNEFKAKVLAACTLVFECRADLPQGVGFALLRGLAGAGDFPCEFRP